MRIPNQHGFLYHRASLVAHKGICTEANQSTCTGPGMQITLRMRDTLKMKILVTSLFIFNVITSTKQLESRRELEAIQMTEKVSDLHSIHLFNPPLGPRRAIGKEYGT